MAELHIQASFNTGEWAPSLNARVDIAKYRSAAALLENFFVDYRGGASTRPGTQYILQAYKSSTPVRLITFQASFNVGYAMEFGDFYIRFFNSGAPVLEPTFAITAATQANPGVLTVTGNNFNPTGDWIYITGVVGMTQLNGNYYSITTSGAAVTIRDLNGNAVDTTAFGAYVSGGTVARVYTLPSPYAAGDLALLKFVQSSNVMFICHPSYPPYVLTYTSATSWKLVTMLIGASVTIPTGVAIATTLAAGSVNYSYLVTAVDSNGQESGPSTAAALANKQDLRTVPGTNHISWNAVSGAISYNIYKSNLSYFGIVGAGTPYGFIGNVTGVTLDDSNIAPNYSETPPIVKNPFQGSGVQSVSVGTPGTYTTVPSATVAGAPSGGVTATVQPILQTTTATLAVGYYGFVAGNSYSDPVTGFAIKVLTVGGSSQILTFSVITQGQVASGTAPTSITINNPNLSYAIFTVTWGVGSVSVIGAGAGYTVVPSITFSSGAATATATLAPSTAGNPSVPGFFQQRLILAALPAAPQTFYASQPGSYYNFNVSFPSQPSDSITGTLVSGQQNTIKAIVPQTAGLLIFTDKYSFLVNGGSNGSAISPSATVANAQSFNGISDVPPIVANYDVLYVQAKGSVIRDSAYNIYQQVFTGTDISILSSHLFYGYSITAWAFAEEPFKLIQCIRNDGVLLTLTFLKEQEFIGWTHSTTAGLFKSVAVVTEMITSSLSQDATYFVVQRTINGNVVQYIERLANRQFPNGVIDAWCVDAGIQYVGSPQTTFMGAQHLAGLTVTGLADGVVIPPFIMPVSGNFTLTTAAAKVTLGIGYTCKLQTLSLELGEPTAQGKVKKINNVDVRVADTLGLKIGQDFNHLVTMKGLVRGNVNVMLTGQQNQIITDLYTGDARTFLSPAYTVPGQYCIQQDLPYPASVLGVIPNVVVGDSDK